MEFKKRDFSTITTLFAGYSSLRYQLKKMGKKEDSYRCHHLEQAHFKQVDVSTIVSTNKIQKFQISIAAKRLKIFVIDLRGWSQMPYQPTSKGVDENFA